MKHFILILCLTCMGAIDMRAQGSSVVFDDYVSDEFKNVVNEVPHYREIKSGSKFVVCYEGNWPAEMMGAFEYAIQNLTANTVVRKTSPLHSNQIDIADLPSGVYALTLTDNSGQIMTSMKFVKR